MYDAMNVKETDACNWFLPIKNNKIFREYHNN